MAHIHKEFLIDNAPERVWEALRDVGAVHRRLVPGFVTDTRMETDTRTVTFANGVVVHELIVDIDDAARRVAYAVIGGSMTPKHHHASMQVLAAGEGRSRFVWTIDVAPDELAGPIDAMAEQGAHVMQETLKHHPGPHGPVDTSPQAAPPASRGPARASGPVGQQHR
ncbi:SRPBCC family protein [Streptomyces sp. NPDC006326]|uniref:SRPBCC family protein n=1 Tax=Streptomyces sp. NPDC006326 TaxID=3156752 RepID=UPI0033BCDC5D